MTTEPEDALTSLASGPFPRTAAAPLSSRVAHEDAVLLGLIRPDPFGALAWLEPCIAAGVSWPAVVDRAWLEQVGPLAYDGARRLNAAAGRPVVPEDTVAALRRHYRGNEARHRELFAILVEVLKRTSSAGIDVMIHKGIALAATVYREPALRVAADIDLSVPEADWARACVVTAEIRQPLSDANPDRRDPRGYHVELDKLAHHDLDASLYGSGRWAALPLDWDRMWIRADSIAVGSYRARVPCPTDLLLTLITNALRRGFRPVRAIADIAHTVHERGAEIDWQDLGAELRRTALDRRSWIALELAAYWLGANIPAHLLEPPPELRMAGYERRLLDRKHEQPSFRLPTRLLWAGSWRNATVQAAVLPRKWWSERFLHLFV